MRNNMMQVLLATAAMAAAPWSFGQGKITGVDSKHVGAGLQLTIQGEDLLAPRVIHAYQGKTTILEFRSTLAISPARFKVNRSCVEFFEYAWFSARPARVRVLVRTKAIEEPSLFQNGEGWVLQIGVKSGVSAEHKQVQDASNEQAMRDAIALLAIPDELKPAPSNRKLILPAAPARAAQTSVEAFSSPLKVDGSPVPTQRKAKHAPKTVVAMAEPFPDHVPAIDVARNAWQPQASGRSMVSLDFVNTDVVQILKALALQTGANIVASPDVSPSEKPLRITLSLNQVTLDDALNLLTAMSGLRYAKVGSTYIVSPAESFSKAMRQIVDKASDRYVTRVINLKSGEGEQIKQATLKSMPQEGKEGWYEIIVPGSPDGGMTQRRPAEDKSDKATVTDTMKVGSVDRTVTRQVDAKDPSAQTGSDDGTQPSMTNVSKRTAYLMLVGEPKRLDDVERYIIDLDSRISAAFTLNQTQDTGTIVVPIFSGQQDRIKQMLQRLLANNPRADDYSISTTAVKELSEGEESTTVLMLMGPNAELRALERFATAIDDDMCGAAGIPNRRDATSREKIYEVVRLKYVEPKLAEFDLKNRVRGLYVTVLPDMVSPGITGESEKKKQDKPTDNPNGTAPTAGSEDKQKKGLGTEPMGLMLRGTREQIERAKQYLAMVDLEPMQVAIEMRVMELTRANALRVGLDWSLLTGGRLTTFRLNQGLGDVATTPGTISGSYTYKGNDSISLLGTLDAMSNDQNLIARPNMLGSDGRSSHLFVGDVVRYVESIVTSQNGTTVTTGSVEVGVTLDLTPRIGDDGNISIHLKPSMSILKGFTPVPGGGSLPQTSQRTVDSFMTMKSGETIAIGGLIQDSDRKQVSGIPLLQNLPLIGQLFRRTDNLKQRSEVVFFLTARVVDNRNRADAANPWEMERKHPITLPKPVKSGGGKDNTKHPG